MDPVIYGDSDAAVLAYLRAKLPAVPMGVDLPEGYDQASTFLVVGRIGGVGARYAYDEARTDLTVWATDRASGQATLQAALGWLRRVHMEHGAYAGLVLYRADVELGPAYLPDPVTSQPRWTSTVSVRCRPARPA